MATREVKFERVDKVDVAPDGSMRNRESRVDRGQEDPGMNFQDKRAGYLLPGYPADAIPFSSDLTDRDLRDRSSMSSTASDRAAGPNGEEYSSTTSRSSSNRAPDSSLDQSYRGESRRAELDHAAGKILRGGQAFSTHSSHHSSEGDMQNLNSGNMINQRTTVVTEVRSNEGLLRSVPIMPHEQRREEHEIIQHESHSRAPETTVISVPSTRFESAKMESTRSGVTYTEDKQLTIPAPNVAPQIHSGINVNFAGGASAEIHATTAVNLASEVQIKDMGPEEYDRYRQKVEQLARQHEMEISQKAASYRNQVEEDADLIRQTLERQHIRDIEFRKDMVESSVDRQQHEIQLEAEYAMRVLEQEREQARAALDNAKMSSNIDVNIDSAVGHTHSQGKVTTTSENRSEDIRGLSKNQFRA